MNKRKIKKKKSFLKILIQESTVLFIFLSTIAFFGVSYLIGYLIPEDIYSLMKLDKIFFHEILMGTLAFGIILLILSAIILLIILIFPEIKKIKAIRNYCYLPLTEEEIDKREFPTMNSYLEFLQDQVTYNKKECLHIKFEDKELYKIYKSCINVYPNEYSDINLSKYGDVFSEFSLNFYLYEMIDENIIIKTKSGIFTLIDKNGHFYCFKNYINSKNPKEKKFMKYLEDDTIDSTYTQKILKILVKRITNS